jgi:Restriction endonuclease NotI
MIIRMPKQPLAEVFGFPINNLSKEAERHRRLKLCPFNNKVPNCTKDKAKDPLGVCSVFDGNEIAITCPVRFRQGWTIVDDAASFFFPAKTNWTSLVEVRLDDKTGKSAGNIDVVLVAYNHTGKIIDFGALEIQAVYISGNVRRPFEFYMEDPQANKNFDWSKRPGYPNPDYLSSSRKRLAPQLIYKGGILNAWKKKSAVALQRSFFETLPTLPEVKPERANLAWFVYDLEHDSKSNRFELKLGKTVYTDFSPTLERITRPEAGSVQNFIEILQEKLDEKLDGSAAPDALSLQDILSNNED